MNIVKTEELFTFPVIMIDPDKEDERDELTQSLGIKVQEEDPEILIGEAMVPHWDFLFIRDRWNLTEESYKKALLGKFECCLVVFDQCGTFISPLSKEKFLNIKAPLIEGTYLQWIDFRALGLKKEELQKF